MANFNDGYSQIIYLTRKKKDTLKIEKLGHCSFKLSKNIQHVTDLVTYNFMSYLCILGLQWKSNKKVWTELFINFSFEETFKEWGNLSLLFTLWKCSFKSHCLAYRKGCVNHMQIHWKKFKTEKLKYFKTICLRKSFVKTATFTSYQIKHSRLFHISSAMLSPPDKMQNSIFSHWKIITAFVSFTD